jgi:enamine deaminase RidA (YjgF/YER057c/UK114 family)
MAGGFARQIERTMANLKQVLEAAGGGWSNVVKMTVYLTDMSYQNELNAVIHRHFGKDNPPPRTLIGVASLSHQDMLIEIDVTAVV